MSTPAAMDTPFPTEDWWWQALADALKSLAESWDAAGFFAGLGNFIAGLLGLLLKLFLVATPFSLAVALASFLSCLLLSRTRAESPQPRMLSYGARNACHSVLLLLLGNAVGAALLVCFAIDLIASGNPHCAALPRSLAAAALTALLEPLLFLAFAHFGMRFTPRRTWLGLLLFTLLSAALLALAGFTANDWFELYRANP